MKSKKDLYPELVNKIRWAICSTYTTGGAKYPYGDAQKIATVWSQEVMELIELQRTVPRVLTSTDTIRSWMTQRDIDRS